MSRVEPKISLRHTLATLAYRGGKVLRDAPEDFATFRVGTSTRTPAEILAHINDVLDWGLSIARGQTTWREEAPRPWSEERHRFHASLANLDEFLASETPAPEITNTLFQGPIADCLTHVGQIALLRRLHGAPVRGENYAMAEIARGRVGPDQPPARKEFD